MSSSNYILGKDDSEWSCLDAFLSIYSPNAKSQRASDVFPELRDRGDWDFNVVDPETAEWDAVELKSVNIEEFITRINYWSKVWTDIGETNAGIEGFYCLVPPQPLPHPSWPPPHIRDEVETAIREICHEVLPSLALGEVQDLGPRIAGLTNHWPKKIPRGIFDVPGDTSTCRIVNDPIEFNVSRGINDISGPAQMELIPISEVFEIDNVDLEALEKLITKANHQLARAKAEGCRRTIMLICGQKGTGPSAIESALKQLPVSSMSEISQIWLVGRDSDHIRRVA
ncbi:MAG: hypothetical protein O3B95_07285 [Chloroflexi bacterium]|nr:hypothetical protein [Chloroflexota bacterium]